MDKETVEKHLEECGEVIVGLSSGRYYELHLHDVEFDVNHLLIDQDEKKYILDYDDIDNLEVHESGPIDE